MFKQVYLWNLRPGVSPEEAEKQYLEVHVPMAKKIPGLRKYNIAKARGEAPPYYRMAELYFDSEDARNAGLASPEGKAAAEDTGFRFFTTDKQVYLMNTIFFEEEEVKL